MRKTAGPDGRGPRATPRLSIGGVPCVALGGSCGGDHLGRNDERPAIGHPRSSEPGEDREHAGELLPVTAHPRLWDVTGAPLEADPRPEAGLEVRGHSGDERVEVEGDGHDPRPSGDRLQTLAQTERSLGIDPDRADVRPPGVCRSQVPQEEVRIGRDRRHDVAELAGEARGEAFGREELLADHLVGLACGQDHAAIVDLARDVGMAAGVVPKSGAARPRHRGAGPVFGLRARRTERTLERLTRSMLAFPRVARINRVHRQDRRRCRCRPRAADAPAAIRIDAAEKGRLSSREARRRGRCAGDPWHPRVSPEVSLAPAGRTGPERR